MGVKKSKAMLEAHLGETVDIIVYPYGSLNTVAEESIRLAFEDQYKQCFLNIAYSPLRPAEMAGQRISLSTTLFNPVYMQPLPNLNTVCWRLQSETHIGVSDDIQFRIPSGNKPISVFCKFFIRNFFSVVYKAPVSSLFSKKKSF